MTSLTVSIDFKVFRITNGKVFDTATDTIITHSKDKLVERINRTWGDRLNDKGLEAINNYFDNAEKTWTLVLREEYAEDPEELYATYDCGIYIECLEVESVDVKLDTSLSVD